jgi:hypothetical protein
VEYLARALALDLQSQTLDALGKFQDAFRLHYPEISHAPAHFQIIIAASGDKLGAV